LLNIIKTLLTSRGNAKIDFSDFNLSVITHFPKVEMEIHDLSIVGLYEFSNDTIFAAKTISSKISIMDMIGNKDLEINDVLIDRPKINFVVHRDGKENWADIQPEISTVAQPKTDGSSAGSLKLKLNDIQINHLNVLYTNQEFPLTISINNTNLQSNGHVSGTSSDYAIMGESEEIVLEYDSVKYISKTSLKADALMKCDFDKLYYSFEKAKFWVNDLPLILTGSFAMPNDSTFFDLGFETEKSDFATILKLLPTDYQKYFEKAEILGAAEFKGKVKGLYFKKTYPAIDVSMKVNDDRFKYQEISKSFDDIQVSAQISKPEGEMNLFVINIEQAHGTISNNPFDLRLLFNDVLSDPGIDAYFSGTLDFLTLSQILQIDSIDIAGIVNAKMQMTGKLSAIERFKYDQFASNGDVYLKNFRIQTKEMYRPLEINQAKIKANTNIITLEQFDGKLGQSDFRLKGTLNNYLSYFLKDGVLKGNLLLNSEFVNFSELTNLKRNGPARTEVKTEVQPTSANITDSIAAFQVPDQLDIQLQSSIKRAVIDQVPVNNLSGLIVLRNRRLDFTNINMGVFDGQVTLNGSYAGNSNNQPKFEFDMNLDKIDLPAAFRSISTFQRYIPVAEKSQGKMSSKFALSGIMTDKMKLVPSSLNGQGVISTYDLMIVDSPVFDQIRGIIKKEKLRNVRIDDFSAQFQFQNGNLAVSPFKTRIADQQASIYGNLSAAREIKMNMDFIVNREDLGADINKGLDILPGSQNIKKVEATVILKGDLSKPDISLDLSKARKQIQNEVTKASKEEIKESVKKLGNELKKLFK